jgi:hypothetical protein
VKRRKPTSQRADRREAARDAEKLAKVRARLAALEPGGSPDRPREIPTASLVEVEAASTRCLRCGGPVRVEEHTVVRHEQGLLRAADVSCTLCGRHRRLYYRLHEPS